ncbi:MAG: hypothetical protein KJO03_09780 [Gammaproteobacteria bacterium]|nr:hypothetical protein [Gammaproteobacteria bacterium]
MSCPGLRCRSRDQYCKYAHTLF